MGEFKKVAYNVKEASELLGVSDKSLYEAIKQHQVPAKWIGRRVIIPISAFNKWLEESQKEVISGI